VLEKQVAGRLQEAALNQSPVNGLTHNFYRYPARFSPQFAATAIELFSQPGDVVLDPYMGGGTTIVEAMAAERRTIGADINSLSIFVTKVKTCPLTDVEKRDVEEWALRSIPQLKYHQALAVGKRPLNDTRVRNLDMGQARFTKKLLGLALSSFAHVTSGNASDFIRCALLKTAQWALDGRRTLPRLTEFREQLYLYIRSMLRDLEDFEGTILNNGGRTFKPILRQIDAANIDKVVSAPTDIYLADLVVTSPPYPGLHVLYHRWQVDGRKETPAPYWIIDGQDGQGESYYNFGGRHSENLQTYFEKSLTTLKAIRNVVRRGAYMVQMVAFRDPRQHLQQYLANMKTAGFTEVELGTHTRGSSTCRIWRDVPSRKWHATLKGKTAGSREVVLVHRATS